MDVDVTGKASSHQQAISSWVSGGVKRYTQAPQPLRCSGGNCKQKSVISLALTVISPQGLLSTISSPAGVATVLWVNERQLGKERLSFRLLGG